MSDSHVCQCKHCGRFMIVHTINLQPAPTPPACEHEWDGRSVWSGTDGQHGSRQCIKCNLYQQW